MNARYGESVSARALPAVALGIIVFAAKLLCKLIDTLPVEFCMLLHTGMSCGQQMTPMIDGAVRGTHPSQTRHPTGQFMSLDTPAC